MIIKENMSIMEKLEILSDAAKYDVSCSSSGVECNNNGSGIGNSKACGICHSFSADGRCISLLKILLTNECIYNCRYCINRASNDVVRATFTPEEVCDLTIQFYKRNYIEGLFLSSGIIYSPDETMKRLLKTVILLRSKYSFGGYIHMKAIPGASEELIKIAGYYVDRMSVNLELPTNAALKKLAPAKTRDNILKPMRMIQNGIHSDVQRLKSSSVNVNRLSGEHTVNAYDDIFDTALSSDVYRLNNSDNSFFNHYNSLYSVAGKFSDTDNNSIAGYSNKRLFQQDRVHR